MAGLSGFFGMEKSAQSQSREGILGDDPLSESLAFGAGLLGASEGMLGPAMVGAVLGGFAALAMGVAMGDRAGEMLEECFGDGPGSGPNLGAAFYPGFGDSSGSFPAAGFCGPPPAGLDLDEHRTFGHEIQQRFDGGAILYTTSGGYHVLINGSTVTVTDPSGRNTVAESGDPGESVGLASTRTLLLPDRTCIVMIAAADNGPIQDTKIYDGGETIHIANPTNQIRDVSFNTAEAIPGDAPGSGLTNQDPHTGVVTPDFKQLTSRPGDPCEARWDLSDPRYAMV